MAYLGDVVLIHDLHLQAKAGGKKDRNSKISLEELARYLEDDSKPITPTLRRWLALSIKGCRSVPFRLVAQRKQGRTLSGAEFEAHTAVYECVAELAGQPVTRDLCERIAKSIKGAQVNVAKSQGRVTYLVGPLPRDAVRASFQLTKGRKISNEIAFEIASLRLNRSTSSVKKIWREFEAARAASD
jgi:hypothetical protein